MAIQPFRFRKLGYVGTTVSDLDRSVAFYRDVIGLDLIKHAAGEVAYFSCSQDHHNLVLYQGREPGLRRLAFEMESQADWEMARDHLAKLGVDRRLLTEAEADDLGQSPTLRFLLPGCRATIELYYAMKQRADKFEPRLAKIQRLGHAVISVISADETTSWLAENFNFRVSDEIENGVTFMRCFPNPYHHSLGIGHSDYDHLHHVAFMVDEVDDIGRAINRLRKAGSKVVFGPGRHGPSESIFLYFLDPDGVTIEYTFGMEEFSEVAPREYRVLPKKLETIDLWEGVPSPEYAKVGHIEASLG